MAGCVANLLQVLSPTILRSATVACIHVAMVLRSVEKQVSHTISIGTYEHIFLLCNFHRHILLPFETSGTASCGTARYESMGIKQNIQD